MGGSMPIHVLRANARTRQYRLWLSKCVVLRTAEYITPREVEPDLLSERAGYNWVAHPVGSGRFLVQGPLAWRRHVLRERMLCIGVNLYEAKVVSNNDFATMIQPSQSWVTIRGLPPEWCNIVSLRELLQKYGYVSEMDWYSAENLDLRYIRIKMFFAGKVKLPPKIAVVLTDKEIEGIVTVYLEIEGHLGWDFAPGPQDSDKVAELRAIIDEMDDRAAKHLNSKLKALAAPPPGYTTAMRLCQKSVASRKDSGKTSTLCGAVRSAEDVSEQYFRLQLLRSRILGGYNGNGGTTKGWVHAEQVTPEVVRAQAKRKKEKLDTVAPSSAVAEKRIVRRSKRSKGEHNERLVQLGPKLGESSGIEYRLVTEAKIH